MENTPIKLISVANNIEAELIINLLHNNNIECLKISKEAGGYMNIYMGYSIFGEDIYVNETDYQTAKELLNEISNNEELLLDEEGNDVDEDYEVKEDNITDNHIPFYKKSKIVSIIILLVALGIIILSVIGNILDK